MIYGNALRGKREAAMGEKVRSTFSEPGSPSHLQLCPGSKKFLPSSLPDYFL
jgi:hypothetical protein